LDRTYLTAFLNDPEALMIRFIDDMLFVTNSYVKASGFIHTVLPGFPEYGVEVNLEKVASNFYHPLVNQKIYAVDDFPWCGLLLDQETLEVRGDYSKMFGSYVKDSLTVQRVTRPIEAFLRQLKIFLKPKLKPVFLMETLNTHETICVNIYQNFVYVAIKVHLYLREMRDIAVPRPELLLKAIEEACAFVSSSLLRVNGRSPAAVPVRWLGVSAFRRVFERKPTIYKGTVLDRLESLAEDHEPAQPYRLNYNRVLCSDQILFQNLLW
jgi:telomerase reverse transcriptase